MRIESQQMLSEQYGKETKRRYMLSEEEIMKLIESRYRMLIRSNNDKYLFQTEILEDVLELDLKTRDRIFKTAIDNLEKR